MKTIRVNQFGGPDVLELVDEPELSPAPGELIVAVEAAAVGFVDVMARRGEYAPLAQPGFVPGVEVAGAVIDVGEGVDQGWRGRRVFAITPTGGYAEQVRVGQDAVVPLPDGLSAGDAVALGVNALVARFALDRARCTQDTSVLVRGAGGGIGALATQFAVSEGARVTAITSSEERRASLINLGASEVIDRSSSLNEVGQFDVVIDTVAGDDMAAYVAKLAPNGRYVLCGGAAGAPSMGFGAAMLERFHNSLAFFCFSLNSVPEAEWRPAAAELFQRAADGAIRPLAGPVLPLSEAKTAHRILEDASAFGKVVLVP